MNEEEKQAIERMKRDYELAKSEDAIDIDIFTEDIKTVLNLLEKKEKIIDLMAEYMEEEFAEYQLDNIYAELNNCNGMERNWTRGKEAEIKDIKRYFNQKIEKGE